MDFFTPVWRELVARAGIGAGERVLDVGCGRATLERVPADAMDEASATARAAFEPARTPRGDYAIHTEIRFTVARV